MDNNINQQTVLYKHITVEGTSYEVGRILGQLIIAKADSFRNIATNFHEKGKAVRIHIEKAIEYFDRYCSGINDEIRGVADTLGVSVEQIIYYINTYKSKGGCSQMVVLPGITTNGHVYAARNYDYRPEESDLCLTTTKVKGKASHIGFSELIFGRDDGINEHGLFISMSNAAPGITSDSIGVDFWAVIRSVLDNCKNVEEAIEQILLLRIEIHRLH
ncbi:C45 family autoproteolytic acyltransferase/hydolase [Clostridium sp. UBA4548]|uniref:C45 family autoproteolytic acyltransferase/hydolase n=1 Tax=Clostridium sp. UBA4548 TaxID=1946361 RepID=UPI0025BCCD3D|nr:C45 family peptidase [Clostridium sp. UBA4548]